ncbi:MAG: DUF6320 domain-containing protein [Clostridia bacterium]
MSNSERFYPEIIAPRFNFTVYRQCMFYFFVSGFIMSVIANLVLGGKPWCLYVLLSEYIFYTRFLTWDLVETSIIKRCFSILFPVCFLLLLIEILEPNVPWSSQMLIPFLYLIALILSSITYFSLFNYQKTNIMPLLHIVSGSMISLIIGMVFIGKLSVALISFSFFSLLFILVSIIWYRKAILAELRKKFRA